MFFPSYCVPAACPPPCVCEDEVTRGCKKIQLTEVLIVEVWRQTLDICPHKMPTVGGGMIHVDPYIVY